MNPVSSVRTTPKDRSKPSNRALFREPDGWCVCPHEAEVSAGECAAEFAENAAGPAPTLSWLIGLLLSRLRDRIGANGRSAATTSLAEENRASGCFSRHFRITESNCSGTSDLTAVSDCGCWVITREHSSAIEFPANGGE